MSVAVPERYPPGERGLWTFILHGHPHGGIPPTCLVHGMMPTDRTWKTSPTRRPFSILLSTLFPVQSYLNNNDKISLNDEWWSTGNRESQL